ncbi:hypothetical protein [Mesorhizobium sp.]|uniref:hypothetical protein n=1 Tax=Mesorhizobium sp. TaxID=1871066 RepID=UPI000FE74DF8|nr:hypothetical protein [Mesorhizobium sp.]RWQ45711.1 MAG: hypothetical protein EOS84_31595 [Mesorhizobium sp.]
MARSGLDPDVANQHYITGYDGWSFYTPVLAPGALRAYIEAFSIANMVSRLPLFRWRIAGLDARLLEGANGLSVAVDVTVDELVSSSDDRRPNQLAIMTGEPVERH